MSTLPPGRQDSGREDCLTVHEWLGDGAVNTVALTVWTRAAQEGVASGSDGRPQPRQSLSSPFFFSFLRQKKKCFPSPTISVTQC